MTICDLTNGSLQDVQTIICLITGIIWIPFSYILGYVSYEHWILKNFLHFTVGFLFFLGAIARTIWLFLAFSQLKTFVLPFVLNRIAILLQFSALSFLLCMWTRSIPKRMSVRNNDFAAKVQASINQLHNNLNNNISNNSTNNTNEIKNNSTSVTSNANSSTSNSFNSLLGCCKQQNWFLISAIIINLFVWLFFISTIPLAFSNYNWYQYTLLGIGSLCLFEALCINIVGIRTGLKMYKELEPTFVSEGKSSSKVSGIKKIFSVGTYVFSKKRAVSSTTSSNKLDIQAKAMRLLLVMSTTLALFFAIRCFCFTFNTLIACKIHNKEAREYLDLVLYPLFYYQIPEFFPTLIVIRGLACRNSIIKRIKLTKCWKQSLSSQNNDLSRSGSVAECSGNDVDVSLAVIKAQMGDSSNQYNIDNSHNTAGVFSSRNTSYDYDDDDEGNVDDCVSYLNSSDYYDEYDISNTQYNTQYNIYNTRSESISSELS